MLPPPPPQKTHFKPTFINWNVAYVCKCGYNANCSKVDSSHKLVPRSSWIRRYSRKACTVIMIYSWIKGSSIKLISKINIVTLTFSLGNNCWGETTCSSDRKNDNVVRRNVSISQRPRTDCVSILKAEGGWLEGMRSLCLIKDHTSPSLFVWTCFASFWGSFKAQPV